MKIPSEYLPHGVIEWALWDQINMMPRERVEKLLLWCAEALTHFGVEVDFEAREPVAKGPV